MTPPKNHQQMRLTVCVACLSPGCKRQVTTTNLEKVRSHIYSGFNVDCLTLPSGICESCRRIISSSTSGLASLPKLDYDHLTKSLKRTSGDQDGCSCYICQAGRSKTFRTKSKKTGPKSDTIEVSSKSVSVCGTCYQKVGRGIRHNCKISEAPDNLVNCANNVGVSEQLAVKVLTDITNTNEKKEDIIRLKRKRGPPLVISTAPSAKKQKIVTHSDLNKLARQLNLSDTKTRENAKAIRTLFGRNVIEKGYNKSLPEKSKVMECMVEEHKLEFIHKRSKKDKSENPELEPVIKIQKTLVAVKNIGDLIQHIQKERGIAHEDKMVKIGMDTGGDFVKVTLNVIDVPKYYGEEEKRRASYGDGISPKQNKDTSVKKLLILAIVSKVQENHENVSQILQALDMSSLQKFKIAADQKLINILCGLQGHSSTYPCPWCIGKSPWTEKASLRTVGMLKNDSRKFKESGSNLKNAKQFFNVVNTPLIIGEDDDLVIDLIPPPELHLLLRPFNYIWNNLSDKWKELVEVGSDPAMDFAKKMNLVRSAYHGGDFEGNQCKGFLKCLDKLKVILPPALSPFLYCLEKFSLLVSGCYGKKLSPSYKDIIQDFSSSFGALGISETPSIHAVKVHIQDFLGRN